ncbi:transcription elongation factor A protein 1-like [Tubulanus polymorphus]|uniref:transcription elongation factor A protein 1-like n=1 Tax=Tubulanus polymorphus TaxID=672921 RepID=UPI003DA6CC1C
MMSCEADVMKIGKKLEKLVSNGTTDQEAKNMLQALKDLPMTLKVLQKTRIGMTVNNVRKSCTDEEVNSLAKSLIKSWKKLLDQPSASGKSGNNETSAKKDSSSSSPRESTNGKSTPPGKTSPKTISFPKASDTNDSVRLKCRELLANALKAIDTIPDGSGDPNEIAKSIEDSIYTEFMNLDTKYKNRVRSRISNLKDTKNPELRVSVLRGEISPERFAVMTADDMASSELKKIREKFTKESIDDHQMAETGGTNSTLLKCGKCKKNNCTYNQVQTRSADEPMTTFVFCNECGNRWKFC